MAIRYGVIELHPMTPAQADAAPDFIEGLLDGYDVKVLSFEYTPNNDVEELAQNTFRMSIALDSTGPEALTLLNTIKSEAESRGITVTVSKGAQSLVDGLIECFQTHGTDLADRPALKACAIEKFKEARVATPEDNQRLKRLLSERGFNSIAEVRAYLNETE